MAEAVLRPRQRSVRPSRQWVLLAASVLDQCIEAAYISYPLKAEVINKRQKQAVLRWTNSGLLCTGCLEACGGNTLDRTGSG